MGLDHVRWDCPMLDINLEIYREGSSELIGAMAMWLYIPEAEPEIG